MKKSVALCVFNGAGYVKLQLESIAAQIVPVDEIVVCDDCSSDDTLSIVAEFIESSDIPVKLIVNPMCLGSVQSFEKAICACSGDIIFFSDSDDIWMPRKVGTICEFFAKHPDKDVVFTDALLVNHAGYQSYAGTLSDRVGLNERNQKLLETGCGYDVLGTSNRVAGATIAMRASFIPYCIPFPTERQMYDEMIAVLALIRNKLGYIDDCLIKYRIHDGRRVGLWFPINSPVVPVEQAGEVFMWHEEFVEPFDFRGREKIRFAFKRFWTLRTPFSFVRLAAMYLRGEYRMNDVPAFSLFITDLSRVFFRLGGFVKRLPRYRIVRSDS